MRISLLGLDVDRFVVIFGIDANWQVKRLWTGARKTGVFVRAPLHWRANAVAIAEEGVVTHADFVAVVNNRCARHGKQEQVEQFNTLAVIAEERREPAA